jgi:predicted nucleotidyltransferase
MDVNFDLASRTIFATVTGSRAYGTSRPESDADVRGVAVAPLNYSTGFLHNFEQAETVDLKFWSKILQRDRWGRGSGIIGGRMMLGFEDGSIVEADDTQIMDFQKFCKLASGANPNLIEQLFIPEKHWLLTTPAWEKVMESRQLFISKKVRHTFSGYAMSQLKRMRTHRRWLTNPPKKQPERADFGLSDNHPIPPDQWRAAASLIERRITDWMLNPDEEIPVTVLDRMREAMTDLVASILTDVKLDLDPETAMFRAAGRQLGFSDNFIAHLDSERKYRGAKMEWKQYQTWKTERNPMRAELEAKYGMDTKHASHLVRLMRMGIEVLKTGNLIVDRSVAGDAEELRAIRNGLWTYEMIERFAEDSDKEMDRLYAESKVIPMKPDLVKIDALCSRIVEEMASA